MSQTDQAIAVVSITDITESDRRSFSDMFKDAYGFRPRFTPDDQDIVNLLNAWPAIMEEQAIQSEYELQQIREQTGIEFANWMSYYDYLDGKEVAEWEAYKKQKAEEALIKADLADPHSPRMAIEFWDHGLERLLV